MHAIQFSRFGGPEVLEVVDLPTPAIGPGQLLVRCAAVGVNFAETLQRQDRYALTPSLPAVPGVEAAGTVAAIGPGVDGFRLGERVAAPLFAAGAHGGGYAQYVLIDAAWAVPLPDGLSWEAAVALQVQGLSALALSRQVPVAGRSVLITAAAGGVGSLLVQLTRQAGARQVIAAVGAADKLDFVRALGADVALDYSQPDWTAALRAASGGQGPELVYESVGGAVTMDCLQQLAPGGHLRIFGALNIQSFALGVPELLGLIFRNQSLGGFALVPLLTPQRVRHDLAELYAQALDGRLQVHVGGCYPLAEAASAHRALEARGTRGKLLLLA
ncbi:quinone oxidoreductase family protein [Plasticicumulans acidivorans]|uniref:NADPH:quinone reductase-like Zn-dependent oxidoreductase n=1 Tax=Plasticicumulans acidivorans TaxID=886464 RepID=A0A317MX27_9GAMM|nr:zinc-binding dehydrogenase [Plasticicumulans acidivorans]PWV59519.1 NADPH:quinone reductase-like Zn-dependent oxidoreductase [Plasticicumulans acidivorans]